EKLKQLPGSEWGIVSFIIPKEVREIAEAKHISMNKVMLERVNETHNQIFNLKPKEREIIHSFLNYKFKEGQDSSKTTQDYQFPPSLQKKYNNYKWSLTRGVVVLAYMSQALQNILYF